MSGNIMSVKTNFTAGELSVNLFGRGDLNIYENGARILENVNIYPTGGVSRRKGLKLVDNLEGTTRLIPFEFNTEQVYLLCFSAYSCVVYKDDMVIAEIETPWSATQIFDINYTQSADTLLIMHPDVEPQKITRNANEVWRIEPWVFYNNEGLYCCPYYNFTDNTVTLTPSATAGVAELVASANVFQSGHVGSYIKIHGGCALITQYVSPMKVVVNITKNLSSMATTKQWEESALSSLRGWPICATFHQDRLVIGGSRSLPNHIWMSQSSDLFNFDYGTGLDDEAVDTALLSDQVNAIKAVISARHLMIFTSGAEWIVKDEIITPESLQVVRQTTVGTYGEKGINPILIDGAMLFVSANGKQLRQFLYSELEDAYQSTDLTLLTDNMINNPIDAAFLSADNVVYFVNPDGTMSCLTSYRTEQVNAWSKMKTQGKFISVAAIKNTLYCCVKRGERYFLEKLSNEAYLDSFITIDSDAPKTVWSGLDGYEGKNIGVIADDNYIGQFMVENGCIELPYKVSQIVAGYLYSHFIEPLPFVNPYQSPHSPTHSRLVSAVFRVLKSKGMRVNLGSGYREIPMRRISAQNNLDHNLQEFSGDIELSALGWSHDMRKAIWSIKSDVPVEFTLLSTTLNVKTK